MEKKLFKYIPNDSNGATPKDIFLVGDFGGGGLQPHNIEIDVPESVVSSGSVTCRYVDGKYQSHTLHLSNSTHHIITDVIYVNVIQMNGSYSGLLPYYKGVYLLSGNMVIQDGPTSLDAVLLLTDLKLELQQM